MAFFPKSARPFQQGLLPATRDQFGKSGLDGQGDGRNGKLRLRPYRKSGAEGHNLVALGPEAFIASIGTFIFAGRIGTDALRAFAAEPDQDRALASAYGHFVLILRNGGEIRNSSRSTGRPSDLPGFRPGDGDELLPGRGQPGAEADDLRSRGLRVHLQRRDARRCDAVSRDPPPAHRPGAALCRADRGVPQLGPSLPAPAAIDIEDSLAQSFDALTQYLRVVGDLFGDNIRMALSGGYDSRLLFAVFRSLSRSPSLFVYGGKRDSDVVIAAEVVAGEGVALRHIDKSQRQPTPDEIPGIVARNFHVEDALPWSGIMTSDAENRARLERSAGGALHVNGGGGEIFRNFFRFGDRPVTAREFTWAFYCQIDPAACTPLFSRGRYVAAVTAKASGVLPQNGRRISRLAIKSLYPNFRCRSWFGRENSINSRFGYSILPFYDHQIVEAALRVPIRYKYVGNYEAALIRKASPRIAAYPTNYGHDFATDAPLKRALAERLSYLWPPYLRQYHHALKAGLRANAEAPRISGRISCER